MKDSGVEWIGEIPEGWKLKRLSFLFEEINKKVSDKDFRPLSVTKQGILPQVEGVAKTDNGDNRKLVQKGNFVINSRSDRKGSSGVSEYEGSVSLINIVFRAKSGVSMQYMHHLLRSYGFQEEFYRWGHGIVADLWTTNSTDASNILLPFPEIEEQSLIADTLTSKCAEVDKVVEQTRATIEEYKKLKQAIITEAVTKGVRGPRPMKPSGVEWIGDIPEEWCCSRVGRHYYITLGKMLCTAPSDDSYSYEPYYCAADVHFEGISQIARKKMWFSQEEKKNLLVKKGDLLVTEGGTGGCAIAHECAVDTYIQNSLMIVRCKENTVETYLRYWLESLIKRSYLDYLCNKVTIIHFTKEKLSKVPFPLPSLEEQQEIATYLDTKCTEIDRIIEKKEQLIEELGSYKKSLIYEYVTGKKEVTT